MRNWKRQMLAGSKETYVTKERKGRAGNGRPVARTAVPDAPTAAGDSRDAAGLAEALASMERRLVETRARLDELDADVERLRREKKELDIQIAIWKGALELVGKEPSADLENLTSRISGIERGARGLPELEQRAIQWIYSITEPKQHAQTLDNV